MKKLILLVSIVLWISMVLAGQYNIIVSPNNGTQPNTVFTYSFAFSVDNLCTNISYQNTQVITTGQNGVGLMTFNLPDFNQTNFPNYLCEYRNGALRKVHNFSDQIFNNISVKCIKYADGTSSCSSSSSGGSYWTTSGDQSGLTGKKSYSNGNKNVVFGDSNGAIYTNDSEGGITSNYVQISNAFGMGAGWALEAGSNNFGNIYTADLGAPSSAGDFYDYNFNDVKLADGTHAIDSTGEIQNHNLFYFSKLGTTADYINGIMASASFTDFTDSSLSLINNGYTINSVGENHFTRSGGSGITTTVGLDQDGGAGSYAIGVNSFVGGMIVDYIAQLAYEDLTGGFAGQFIDHNSHTVTLADNTNAMTTIGDIKVTGDDNTAGSFVSGDGMIGYYFANLSNAQAQYAGYFQGSWATNVTLGTLSYAVNANGNSLFNGDITANNYIGNGSQLTGIVSDNSSWNQSYANSFYYLKTNPSNYWNVSNTTTSATFKNLNATVFTGQNFTTSVAVYGSSNIILSTRTYLFPAISGTFALSNITTTGQVGYHSAVGFTGSTNFNYSAPVLYAPNITIQNILALGLSTLQACSSGTNGNFARNTTNVYYCNSTCWTGWGHTNCG